jgi:ABC-type bacteriocin/lantibiotic exporter with double-glycine peptidase domain
VLEASFPLDVMRPHGDGPSGAFKKLWALARMERSDLTTVVFYAVVIGVLTLVLPVSVQALVNTIAFGSVLQPLIILGLAMLAGLVLSAVLQTLRLYVVELLQRRIYARVVNDFGRRIPRWSAAAHRSHDLREISNRFFDVVTLQKSAASLAVDALGLTLQTVMGLLLLAFYHPVLLAFDVVLVMAMLAIIVLPLRRSAASAISESKAKYATAAWLQEISDHDTLFADARGGRTASARAESHSRHYLAERAGHWRDLLTQIVGGLTLQVVAVVTLLLVGGYLVMQRQLTLGQLVASELVLAAIGAGFAKLGKQME